MSELAAQERLERIAGRLREQGLRVTPQRMIILRALYDEGASHPDIEAVYARVRRELPMISLATVYKTVALLRELGELAEIALPDGSRYDPLRPEPHPHLVCARCRGVVDVEPDLLAGPLRAVAEATGWETRLDMALWGLCPNCRSLPPKQAPEQEMSS